jgi:hypothetical protein
MKEAFPRHLQSVVAAVGKMLALAWPVFGSGQARQTRSRPPGRKRALAWPVFCNRQARQARRFCQRGRWLAKKGGGVMRKRDFERARLLPMGDFVCRWPKRGWLYKPTGEVWTAAGVRSRVSAEEWSTRRCARRGAPAADDCNLSGEDLP